MAGMHEKIRLLSRQDVLDLGADDIELAKEAVKFAFDSIEGKTALQPAKTSLRFKLGQNENEAGVVNVLPSAIKIKEKTYYGVKTLGAMPTNSSYGLPRATGTLTIFGDEFKSPLCIMDAQVISAMRTGAVSALAAEKICDKDTRVIGCIGAGVNMYTQLLGVLSVLKDVRIVKIYSRGDSKYKLVNKLHQRFPSIEFRSTNTRREAAYEAQLIITCVANSSEPVLAENDVPLGGVTVFNIGCLENDPELLGAMDIIISDNWQQSKHRGVQTHAVAYLKGIISDEDVTDLGDIMYGRAEGRSNSHQRIFFGPTGLGVEDLALGGLIYESAVRRGVGTIFQLWDGQEWI